MTTVNMLKAKTNLSKLVEAVESGTEKEIIIARNGKPVARIVPIEAAKSNGVRLGLLDGQFADMSLEEFDADNAEIARLFNDGPLEPPEPAKPGKRSRRS